MQKTKAAHLLHCIWTRGPWGSCAVCSSEIISWCHYLSGDGGVSPYLQSSSQTSAACRTTQFSSDTVCLEIGSGSAGWGLSPTKQILTHLWCQLQVQVLTCTSDQLAESNMLMIQLRNLTLKERKHFPFITGCSVLSWQIYVL